MIKFGLALVLGAAVGAAAFWYFTQGGGASGKVRLPSPGAIVDRFDPNEIKAELARGGAVVREKARQAGATLSDAAANAKITAAIKAKFLTDRELPSMQLGVDTTDGVVTLSGKVSSAEAVARAVRIAFDTDGVTKVYSTIQIVPETKPR
jgi:osmotically-inducible protein OsmY